MDRASTVLAEASSFRRKCHAEQLASRLVRPKIANRSAFQLGKPRLSGETLQFPRHANASQPVLIDLLGLLDQHVWGPDRSIESRSDSKDLPLPSICVVA